MRSFCQYFIVQFCYYAIVTDLDVNKNRMINDYISQLLP